MDTRLEYYHTALDALAMRNQVCHLINDHVCKRGPWKGSYGTPASLQNASGDDYYT